MKLISTIRPLLALFVIIVTVLLLMMMLNLTNYALELWQHLQSLPAVFTWLVGVTVGTLLITSIWVIWRILRPSAGTVHEGAPEPLDEVSLRERVQQAEVSGVDIQEALHELEELGRRRVHGRIQITLFGEISSGKSSLIRALVPQAEAETSVTGGTTRELMHYHWVTAAGDELVLTDVPGLNETGGELDALAMEEAHRAHIVVFVCEGDLSRSEFNALNPLLALEKPLIVAINKLDRYSTEDQDAIRTRVRERLEQYPELQIVGITTRPAQTVVRQLPDGSEEEVLRTLPPLTGELEKALQRAIDGRQDLLESLRDNAIFGLVASKLDDAEAAHRRHTADELVRKYTRRAILGGLAAISPGTDILIQGYLGTSLVRELCAVYDVPARELEIEKVLDLSTRQIRKVLPLILAVAGNAFKAFPGVGTIAGGLMHAVAYGLIFDTLGTSVATILETRGELRPAPTSLLFREKLGEDLDTRIRSLARLALESSKDQKRQ